MRLLLSPLQRVVKEVVFVYTEFVIASLLSIPVLIITNNIDDR